MDPKRTSDPTVGAIPAPTTTVRVSDRDELDVWVVGEGTPIVLVHGALVWSLLKPLAEELASLGGYRAIWYHRRGYNGRPTEPPVEWSDQARDVVAILDALGIDKAHVVGHSAGSAYVLELATLAQERLLSAIMLEFVLGQVPSGALFIQPMKRSLEKAQAGDFVGAATDVVRSMGGSEELFERALPGSWSALAGDAATMFRVEVPASMRWKADPEKIGAIEIPMAFVVVSELPPFRETGELIRAWQPDLTLLELSADHHFFPISATAETAAVIDGWIERQDAVG